MTRLEQLQQFVRDEPEDPFNIYALALEYLKSDPAEAEKLFSELLASHPSYLPTYYQTAGFFASAGRNNEAIGLLVKGIALAKEKKDFKALRELQAMHDDLAFE